MSAPGTPTPTPANSINAAQRPVSARGLLSEFCDAHVLQLADVHVAQTVGRLCREADERVLLAVALTVRALRTGAVCLEVRQVQERVADELHDPALDPEVTGAPVAELAWPEPDEWLALLAASPLVAQGFEAPANQLPVRLVDDLLYLERYWQEETVVRTQLDDRSARPVPPVDELRLARALNLLFDGSGLDPDEDDQQKRAARAAASGWTTVVAGGPGTGKTTTVAKLLATLQAQTATPLRIALAAPSGKAAARLDQAVTQSLAELDLSGLPAGTLRPVPESASTLHKLLESRGAGGGFGRSAANPLPHHVVVVDEVSMVALPLMARLLEALREDTRLVLVGDHHQLTSVDAGSVLSDLVTAAHLTDAPDRGAVVELEHTWRFGGDIKVLADAIRRGDAGAALAVLERGEQVRLTAAPATELSHWTPADSPELADAILGAGRAVHTAARRGDVADALAHLDDHRLLCAHREGRFGVARWGRLAEEHLARSIPGYGAEGEWYPGRPLLVTQNLRDLELSNGDSGVVVASEGSTRAAIGDARAWRLFSPYLLDQVTSLHAMTVHKAQGSQFRQVTLVLPPADSPLLTRELLYTAVTRASEGVHLLGDPESVRRAVLNPSGRSSGLARGW